MENIKNDRYISVIRNMPATELNYLSILCNINMLHQLPVNACGYDCNVMEREKEKEREYVDVNKLNLPSH